MLECCAAIAEIHFFRRVHFFIMQCLDIRRVGFHPFFVHRDPRWTGFYNNQIHLCANKKRQDREHFVIFKETSKQFRNSRNENKINWIQLIRNTSFLAFRLKYKQLNTNLWHLMVYEWTHARRTHDSQFSPVKGVTDSTQIIFSQECLLTLLRRTRPGSTGLIFIFSP